MTYIFAVSDSCYEGTSSDKSGPSLVQLVSSQSTFTAEVVSKLVPDDQDKIEVCILIL
jgi:molybdopterin biosynthesis enzyme MoaB